MTVTQHEWEWLRREQEWMNRSKMGRKKKKGLPLVRGKNPKQKELPCL